MKNTASCILPLPLFCDSREDFLNSVIDIFPRMASLQKASLPKISNQQLTFFKWLFITLNQHIIIFLFQI